MKGYRKVLIAVNGSVGPLEKGLELASDEKCWVTVLKVLPPYEGDIDITGIKSLSDVLDSGSREVGKMLKDIVNESRSLAKVMVEQGEISDTITRVAREQKCDLIIMGRKKARSWIGRLLGDNVSSKVVAEASCPVLFVAS